MVVFRNIAYAASGTLSAQRTGVDREMTLREFFKYAVDLLRSKGIDQPKSDAEWLFSETLGMPRLELYLHKEQELTAKQENLLVERLNRRAKREPLQYILGEVEFLNIRLKVNPYVLIPRPETECLTAWVIEKLTAQMKKSDLPTRSYSILDLGTGSGAIAIALAKCFPKIQVLAIDYSAQALKVAQKNAELNEVRNVKFSKSDWFSAIDPAQRFDFIISNPPYLTTEEYDTAQSEVRDYEPKSALVSGEDGMTDLDKIVPEISKYLKPSGWCAIETGILHPKILCERYGHLFARSEAVQDLTKRDRFFMGYRACDSQKID